MHIIDYSNTCCKPLMALTFNITELLEPVYPDAAMSNYPSNYKYLSRSPNLALFLE